MIDRRTFVAAVGLALGDPPRALAQATAIRAIRVGFLGAESLAAAQEQVVALRTSLGELGYFEGRNLAFEVRVADSDYARLPALATELARSKVDVIVASGSKAGYAAKDAARTTPILVTNMGDALRAGFAASLAQPGGNVTGMSMLNPEVTAKQLEYLREIKPRLARVALLMNPANPNADLTYAALQREADRMNVAIQRFDARGPGDIPRAVRAIAAAGIDAMIVQSETLFVAQSRVIASAALANRIAAAGIVSLARDGGLVGYSADRSETWAQIAKYVDRIAKGDKAGELPIVQPTRFLTVINLGTAKALGLTIPASLELRAELVR